MEILKAFNNQIDIRQAAGRNEAQICTLFHEINAHHDTYGVDTVSQQSLKAVVDEIDALVKKNVGQPRVAATPVHVKYLHGSQTFELRTLFDLVGWIFSVTGPAPENATWSNYYYPLAGLYSYFCHTLLGYTVFDDPKNNCTPQMIHLSHFPYDQNSTRVVLGANLDNPRSNKKLKMRENRAAQLSTSHLLPAVSPPADSTQAGGMPAWEYGSCAETFPFILINNLALSETNRKEVRGFASRPFVIFSQAGDYRLGQGILDGFEDPCGNCKLVLEKAGFLFNNFIKPT